MMDLTQNSEPRTPISDVCNPHQPAIEILHQKLEMVLKHELDELERSKNPAHRIRFNSLFNKVESIKKTIQFLQTQGGKS